MSVNSIITSISTVPAGRFFKVAYKTDLPLYTKYKKEGIRIVKITEAIVRTGVEYSNISAVKKYREEHSPKEINYTNHYSCIVKNRLKNNSKTGKDYAVISPVKNSHSKSTYVLVNEDGSGYHMNEEQIRLCPMIQCSYFRDGSAISSCIKTIDVNNIIYVKV